jgi:threonine-phosphate decarboxylase
MKDDHRFSDHGGDWYSFLEEFGNEPLDFSANVSPLGLPESARDAARRALCESARYPDPFSRALRQAIAKEYRVPAEWVFCGNGAADIIYRIAYAARPRRALLLAPCFAEYERALRRAGAEVDFYFPDALSKGRNKKGSASELETAAVPDSPAMPAQGFRITDVSRFLRHIHPDTDMIMLGEPNNPTGLCTDRTILTEIADFCEARGIRLVLDECFMDFVSDGKERSWFHRWGLLQEEGKAKLQDNLQEEGKAKLRDTMQVEGEARLRDETSAEDIVEWREPIRYRNVCVIRAFTKFYGMAGLRLGWCAIPDREFLGEVILAGPPWSVSCAAQAAGIAVLGDHAYRDRLRAMVGRERPRLIKGLQRLGFFVLPGEANYLMFFVPGSLYRGKLNLKETYEAEHKLSGPLNLCDLLRPYGIMLRDLQSFYGMGPGWYRTAVRTEEENERLLAVLSEIFGTGQ